MINKLKKIAKIILNRDNNGLKTCQDDNAFLLERFTNHALPTFLDFSFDILKDKTLSFVNSMRVGVSTHEYKYASGCKTPNIYSSPDFRTGTPKLEFK